MDTTAGYIYIYIYIYIYTIFSFSLNIKWCVHIDMVMTFPGDTDSKFIWVCRSSSIFLCFWQKDHFWLLCPQIKKKGGGGRG